MSVTRRIFLYFAGLIGFIPLAAKTETATESETFSFCVGRPWEKSWSNPHSTSISTYAHGSVVQHGMMADAEAYRQYVNERTGEENFIYKLVKVK